MGLLNQAIARIVTVRDIDSGAPIIGLASGAFAFTLQRLDAGALISSPESISLAELGSGRYELTFTPTEAATLYYLSVSMANPQNSASPFEFQEDVLGFASAPGPYLTTLSMLKIRLGIASSDVQWDAVLMQLIAAVTREVERIRGAAYFESSVTEYLKPDGEPVCRLWVGQPPVTSVSGLWYSTDFPPVADATTLLEEDTDYVVETDSVAPWGSRIVFAKPVFLRGRNPVRAFKLSYSGGFSIVDDDLREAVHEVIQAKWSKGLDRLYHLTSRDRGDGVIAGIRFDDWPDGAKRIVEPFRLEAGI